MDRAAPAGQAGSVGHPAQHRQRPDQHATMQPAQCVGMGEKAQDSAMQRRHSSDTRTAAAATTRKTNPDACATAPDCKLLEPPPLAAVGMVQPSSAQRPGQAPSADPESRSQEMQALQRSMDFLHGPAPASTAVPDRVIHRPTAVQPAHPPTPAASAAASTCGDDDETPDCSASSS